MIDKKYEILHINGGAVIARGDDLEKIKDLCNDLNKGDLLVPYYIWDTEKTIVIN